jgi:hypothetical protein
MSDQEPTVGDAFEAAARALEAVAMVMRRLAEREEAEQARTHIPAGDCTSAPRPAIWGSAGSTSRSSS